MSEDYPGSCSSGSGGSDDDDGGYDGLMDDKEEKELMVECGQRQVCAWLAGWLAVGMHAGPYICSAWKANMKLRVPEIHT